MNNSFQIPLAAALAVITFTLASCQKAPSTADSESEGAAMEAIATEASGAPIAVSSPRIVLPAVGGNPAAAYFELTNSTAAPLVLTGASVAGASKAELHETSGTSMAALENVTIAPGQKVTFTPGGKHLMVFGLPPIVANGGSVQLILKFADGQQQKVDAALETVGGGMEGMVHDGAMH